MCDSHTFDVPGIHLEHVAFENKVKRSVAVCGAQDGYTGAFLLLLLPSTSLLAG